MKRNKFLTVLKIIFYPIYRLIFWYSVEGMENIPKEGGVIFCANHISIFDPVLWVIVIRRRICFMAKKEFFQNKLSAWLFRKLDVFPVDREGKDLKAIKTAIKTVKDGNILGIYPEGTRSKDGKPHEAKAGVAYIARSCKCDVIPVAMRCKGKLRPFKRVKLVVGKPISQAELFPADLPRNELQIPADYIMNKIKEIWENI